MLVRNFRNALLALAILLAAVTSIEAATISLAWDRSQDSVTTGYVIRYGTSPGNYTQTIDVGNVTSRSITTLTDGVRYYFAVQAYDSSRRYGPMSTEVNGVAGSTGGTGTLYPPRSLVSSVAGTSVNLTWQPPSSGTVTGYRVEVGTSSGQSNTRTASVGTGTTYSVTGLAAGTYYIRVRAIYSSGTSGPSNEVTATISSSSSTTIPPPTSLTATVRSDGSVYLDWQPPSSTTGLRGYFVEVGRSSGASDVRAVTVGTTSYYTVTGLAAGTYYFRVRSVTSTGVSAPSNQVSRTIGSTSGVPEPPTNLAGVINSWGALYLTWRRPASGPAVTSYRVEVGRSSGSSNVGTYNRTTTDMTVQGLTEGVYYIRVRSVNASGVSAPSGELRKTIGTSSDARIDATSAGTQLKAIVRDGNIIDLSWQLVDESATAYRIELGSAPAQSDVSTFTTGVTSSFTIGDLPAGTYFMRVRAGHEDGFGEATEEVSASIGSSDAPQQLRAAPATDGAVTLAWDEPQDARAVTGYVVEAGTAPGRADIASIPSEGRSLTTSPIANGTYFVRVRSLTAAGAGSASNEIVVNVGASQQCTAAPATPNLAANVAGSRVDLSWTPAAGEPPLGYVLDVGTSRGRSDVASLSLAADATTLSTDAPDGSYALRLIAFNACGASAQPSDAVVTIGGPVIALPEAPANLTPAVNGNEATLTWSPAASGGQATSYAIEVISPSGETLLAIDTGNASTTFTHGSVPAGEYVVRVRGVNARGAGAPSNSVRVSIQ